MAFDGFRDTDGDGLRDDHEEPAPGIVVAGGGSRVNSDAQGYALIAGLAPDSRSDVAIQLESIEDPYLIPPASHLEIAARPGRVVRVAYPLTPSGEAALRFVVRNAKGGKRGVAALDTELCDTRDGVAVAARTDYDGIAVFEKLRPGRYEARLRTE